MNNSKSLQLILCVFTLLVLTFVVDLFCSFVIGSPLEEAVLKGDWEKIIRILEKDDKKAKDPVARLIMAHACMVTNRDNEAFLLFHSVNKVEDKDKWLQWTESLLKSHPQNPIALYLSADALSRQGKFKEAIERLSKSINLKPDFSSAIALRGVLYFLINDSDRAVIDLMTAVEITPNNAYIRALLGIYYVLIGAPEGALEQFNKAIQINPYFSLAYNGKGCALFKMGEFDRAAHNFYTAMSFSPALLSAQVNYALTISAALKFMNSNSKEKSPGTTLQTITGSSLHSSHIPGKLLNTNFSSLPSQKLNSLVSQYGLNKVKVAMTADFAKHMDRIATHTFLLNDKFSKIKPSWQKPIRNIMQIQISQTINTIGSSVFLNKVPSTGWKRYNYEVPQNLPSSEQLSQQAAQLRESARKDIITWAKSTLIGALTEPLKPNWFKNLETIFKITKAVTPGTYERRNSPAEDIDTLKPIASVGGIVVPHSSLLIPIGKIYCNIALDALASINIKEQMKSIDNDQIKPPPIPSEFIKRSIHKPLGYYISPRQSLFDMNALATKLNKEITTPNKRVLIVSGNPFKATIMEQILYRQGFTTKIIPPIKNVLKEARNFGANAIVGIKLSKYKYNPIEEILKREAYIHHSIQELKKPRRLYPSYSGGPGGGGGANWPTTISPTTSSLKKYQTSFSTDWSWAKPFVPNYPKGAPGGISTKEIAKAFVDKGNWPLFIDFGTGY